MRVLMLMPPYVKGFMRNARWDAMTISGSQWYPIFMSYATGLLEKNGHEVKLVDAQVDGLSNVQVYDIARKFKPELMVVSFSMKSLWNDLNITESISALTDSDSVFVGHASSTNPSLVLSSGIAQEEVRVKKIIKGEGFDWGVLDLANKVPLKDIKGLVYKEDDIIHTNEPRPLVTGEELDKYPFVTSVYKKHLHIKNYWLSGHHNPYVDLFTGRGCSWGRCQFCSWCFTMYGGVGNKYRTRSVGNVIEELRYIKEELPQIKEVYFQDDNLPAWRAREISEAILENHIKIRWSSYSRADLDYETMKVMKKSGCYLLETGFESSSQEVLNGIKKGVTVAQMEKYAKDAQRAGITVIGAFITGLPYETVDSIKATVAWLNKQPILRYTITLPKAYPETGFWKWLEEHDCLKDGKPNYPNLTTEQIYEWNKWSLKQSYLNWNFIRKELVRPSDWGRVLKSAYYFIPYIFGKEKESNKDLEW